MVFEALPTFVNIHIAWTLLMFTAFLAVYRKYRKAELEMLEYFSKFFFYFSVPFFGLMTAGIGIGAYYDIEIIRTLGYVVAHFFSFVSIGYLWLTVTSIGTPKYKKFFWIFILIGLVIAGFGLWEMPDMPLTEEGNLEGGPGPGSTFSLLIMVGYFSSAIAIALMGFYAAYISNGESRIKLGIISFGVLLTFIVSGTLQNMGYNRLGDVFNLIWIIMFLTVAYWSEIKGWL